MAVTMTLHGSNHALSLPRNPTNGYNTAYLLHKLEKSFALEFVSCSCSFSLTLLSTKCNRGQTQRERGVKKILETFSPSFVVFLCLSPIVAISQLQLTPYAPALHGRKIPKPTQLSVPPNDASHNSQKH